MTTGAQEADLTRDSRGAPAWAPAAGSAALVCAAGLSPASLGVGVRVALLAAAAVPWLLLVVWWRSGRVLRGVGVAVGVVALARIGLALTPPALSGDVYRYAFEGRCQQLGATTPYVQPPGSEALRALRPAWFDRVNHPSIPSIYFPAAQWLFRLTARGPYPVRAVKLALALVDVGVVLVLLYWLRRRGSPPAGALVYGACPLAIAESSLAGHVDVLLVLGLVVGLALVDIGRRRVLGAASGAAFAVASLVKPPAFVAFVLALSRRRPGRRGFRVAALCGALAAGTLVTLPYLPAGGHLFEALSTYASRWRANDAAFAAVLDGWRGVWAATGLDHAGPGGGKLYGHVHVMRRGVVVSGRESRTVVHWAPMPSRPGFPAKGRALLHLGLWPQALARDTVALLGLALLVWLFVLARRRPERFPAERLALAAIAGLLFLSPTAFPWYWTSALALVPVCFEPALVVLAACLPLHYLVALPGVGTADGGPWWLRLCVYGPAVLVLVARLRTGRLAFGRPPAPAPPAVSPDLAHLA